MRNVRSVVLGVILVGCGLQAVAQEPARRINTWAVLGPFEATDGTGRDHDFLGGESHAAPKLGETAGGMMWRYLDDRLYCRNQDDYVDLYTFFMDGRPGGPGGGAEHRVAYCAGYVWSGIRQSVMLRFSANDLAKVWVGGNLVFEQREPLEAMRDTGTAPLTLEPGWNLVVVKVTNARRIWGFYFNLTDDTGKPLDGLEWCPDDPGQGRDLAVLTTSLPKAYNHQPYVWLDVRNPEGQFPWDNPSASPFRLLAKGGTPPYSWAVEGLPQGLTFEASEGEIRGKTDRLGTYAVTVTVKDSGYPAQRSSQPLELTVAPRPTEEWWEHSSRLGGLRHNGIPGPTFWTFDHVEEQIDYMKRMGYAWQAYTAFAAWEFGPDKSIVIPSAPHMLRYRDALRAAGIRFAQYMSFKDFRDLAASYKEHADNMHEALELLMKQNQPVLWIFDEMYGRQFRPTDQVTVEFDALYSLIRTLDPSCLVTVNGDTRARDYECGDLDILFVHGAYKEDSYWGYWTPAPLFHNNPKYLPADSWKLPWKGYMDPQEWCRAIVTQLAEPSNAEALHSIQIDPTPFLEADYHTVDLLRAIADWMEPRQASILGTRPLGLPDADWGYAVRQPATGDVYLHILKNPFGKRGLFERSYIDLEPFEDKVVEATVHPSGQRLPYVQQDNHVAIDMRAAQIDPVDTIVRLKVTAAAP